MDIDLGNGNVENIRFYQYVPNKIAAFIFVALFAIVFLGHVVRTFQARSWYFISLLIGCICETFGYYGRAWASDEPRSIKPYVLQNFLILGAPPLIAATLYVSLGRMILTLRAEKFALLSPRKTSVIYILIDVAAFLSQIAGVGLQAAANLKVMKIGGRIILAGLIFQLIALAIFILLAVVVQRRIRQNWQPLVDNYGRRWHWYFYAVQISIILLFLRNLVRAIQYGQGANGMVARHEAFVYVFDASAIWLLLSIMLVLHAGYFARQAQKHIARVDEKPNFAA